jgi:hypothetical protein
MKKFIWYFLLFAVLFTISSCGRPSVLVIDDGIIRTEILFVHNAERIKNGLDPLEMSSSLLNTAQFWAESMAKKDRMVHGNTFIHPEFGYGGENIAWGQTEIDQVMDAWMNSVGHRNNILNKKFTHAGFGYARMSDGRPYWCAQFGGN